MKATVTFPAHYSVISRRDADGMKVLRDHFGSLRSGGPDECNVVLFSTSGVHGSYRSIEDVRKEGGELTYLILMPRTVCVVYGNCTPRTEDDFKFLRRLRRKSREILAHIGDR